MMTGTYPELSITSQVKDVMVRAGDVLAGVWAEDVLAGTELVDEPAVEAEEEVEVISSESDEAEAEKDAVEEAAKKLLGHHHMGSSGSASSAMTTEEMKVKQPKELPWPQGLSQRDHVSFGI